MSILIDVFYDTLYSGCVMSWFILVFSLYGSFRHGSNRSPGQAPRHQVPELLPVSA